MTSHGVWEIQLFDLEHALVSTFALLNRVENVTVLHNTMLYYVKQVFEISSEFSFV